MNEWLPTGAIIGFGGWLFTVLRADLKAGEARQQEALKAMVSLLREDLKASEARQREDLKDGLGRLEAKVDRLLESRLPAHPQ